jgi:drug/metabolite transporter (DMT)-like permease
MPSRAAGGATTSPPPWRAAWALAGYLIAFTAAYTRIDAASGALLLFGAVQVTMVSTGLLRGERPARIDWLGAALAAAGLLVLTLPGARATDPVGGALMILAGACWGAYSIMGRGSLAPLAETAWNFARTSVLVCLPLASLAWPPTGSTAGFILAALSGVLASGLGYTIWYAALPALSAWQAALLQLLVPVITAAGAFLFLGEPITARLVIAGLAVAAGVWLTASPRWHRR